MAFESNPGDGTRRLPVGAEVHRGVGTHFRVWTPGRTRVEVVIERPEQRLIELRQEEQGYFSRLAAGVGSGALYRFRLDRDARLAPDPASRFQPEGPKGPSEVIDPSAFSWSDDDWRGVRLPGQVIYEMHVGTFTPEGTWEAATQKLDHLADLGVTAIEVLPVTDFVGRFGWGYDGVDLFAPTRLYGRPDDFRTFVDRAHRFRMAVILDVVYNHVGPEGSYLEDFSEYYFSDRYSTDWGKAINFDGDFAGPVREFFIANAGYWIEEFHLDGLRLDATQDIHDDSREHVLTAITRRVREAAGNRDTLMVAENEPQEATLTRPADRGGYGADAVWNDDFHHAAMVALTGRREAYYTDYSGTPQEIVSSVKWGYLYQGQYYKWQDQRRGEPVLDLHPATFVHYMQNHDQIANSLDGSRLHLLTSPGRLRAMTTLMLLAPQTPMLFQGQEFAASSPFLYFADHEPEVAQSARRGRKAFLRQWESLAQPESQERVPDPGDASSFERSKLDWSECQQNEPVLILHRDLLALRREDETFRSPKHRGVDGAVLGDEAFVVRFFGEESGSDRLLLVNLGRDLHFSPAPEPLLAPPGGRGWKTLLSTEDVRYGGAGTSAPEREDGWRIPGHAALVLIPARPDEE